MFTLICKHRRAWVIFAALAPLLAGCADEDFSPPPLQAVSLFQGDIVVAGPTGYCIDKASLRRKAEGSFVMLASCESLAGKRGKNVPPAVLTVSVLPQGEAERLPKAAELAGSSTPVETLENGDISLVYLPGGGDRYIPGGDPKHWRAGMVLNGHIIGLAVYGLADSVASKEAGKQLIIGLAARLRHASPVRAEAEE